MVFVLQNMAHGPQISGAIRRIAWILQFENSLTRASQDFKINTCQSCECILKLNVAYNFHSISMLHNLEYYVHNTFTVYKSKEISKNRF